MIEIHGQDFDDDDDDEVDFELSGSDTVSGFLRRVSDLIRTCLYQVSCIRRMGVAYFSRGFRKVFARLSLQKYFRERFARAETNQFLRPAGAPAARKNWYEPTHPLRSSRPKMMAKNVSMMA